MKTTLVKSSPFSRRREPVNPWVQRTFNNEEIEVPVTVVDVFILLRPKQRCSSKIDCFPTLYRRVFCKSL